METPIMEKYYKEHEPMKRKKLLMEAIEAGEDRDANEIRRELWELRYQDPSEVGEDTRADGFLALWMTMEFNRNSGSRLFGWKTAQKEISKVLKKLKFTELQEKSDLHRELLYQECLHLVRTYLMLCETDKSYNTTLFGIATISSDAKKKKIRRDIRETAIELPVHAKMEKELELITQAALEIYQEVFPDEEALISESTPE